VSAVDTPSRPDQLLTTALERLRLAGAIFFRAEMSDPFAIGAAPNAMARHVHPGADRLLEFHIMAEGRAWVTGPDGDRMHAEAGDVVVVPYGDEHTITGETPTDSMVPARLVDPPPWDSVPFVRWGGGGATTEFVCGYLVSDDPLFDPNLRVFPAVFVVRLPDSASRRWVEASIRYAMEQGLPGDTDERGDPGIVATRLPELVVIEVMKAHLAQAPAADHGLLAALHDPVLAPALAAVHAAPERHWTVAQIAAEASVSRSVIDERFRERLGLSPIRYLAEWRMHHARELLAATDATVFAIARRVGYDSEEAFSRAFKRAHGESPGRWRAERRGAAASR
jgi:AraC-like DNA-binding protein